MAGNFKRWRWSRPEFNQTPLLQWNGISLAASVLLHGVEQSNRASVLHSWSRPGISNKCYSGVDPRLFSTEGRINFCGRYGVSTSAKLETTKREITNPQIVLKI